MSPEFWAGLANALPISIGMWVGIIAIIWSFI